MNKEFEIYKLTNTNNNKIYIGVTTLGVSQRFKVHLKLYYNILKMENF